MSDAPSESDTCTVAAGTDETTTKEADKEKLDLSFDPSNQSAKPSLRKPKLTEAELSAAVKLGFSEKYLPSSITGREGTSPHQNNSISDRSSYKSTSSASMINNNHSNSNTNQVSGSQNQYPFFVDNYSFGLTREEQDGLLDPLRRPDINQLPPGNVECPQIKLSCLIFRRFDVADTYCITGDAILFPFLMCVTKIIYSWFILLLFRCTCGFVEIAKI